MVGAWPLLLAIIAFSPAITAILDPTLKEHGLGWVAIGCAMGLAMGIPAAWGVYRAGLWFAAQMKRHRRLESIFWLPYLVAVVCAVSLQFLRIWVTGIAVGLPR